MLVSSLTGTCVDRSRIHGDCWHRPEASSEAHRRTRRLICKSENKLLTFSICGILFLPLADWDFSREKVIISFCSKFGFSWKVDASKIVIYGAINNFEIMQFRNDGSFAISKECTYMHLQFRKNALHLPLRYRFQ